MYDMYFQKLSYFIGTILYALKFSSFKLHEIFIKNQRFNQKFDRLGYVTNAIGFNTFPEFFFLIHFLLFLNGVQIIYVLDFGQSLFHITKISIWNKIKVRQNMIYPKMCRRDAESFDRFSSNKSHKIYEHEFREIYLLLSNDQYIIYI